MVREYQPKLKAGKKKGFLSWPALEIKMDSLCMILGLDREG